MLTSTRSTNINKGSLGLILRNLEYNARKGKDNLLRDKDNQKGR